VKLEPTKNLVAALRQIAKDLICDDGVANQVVGECSERMQALAELTARQNKTISILMNAGDNLAYRKMMGLSDEEAFNAWRKAKRDTICAPH
jgi:hypothetical protein